MLNAARDQSAEQIKQLIVDNDGNFSLVNSGVVGATHRVLWYNLDNLSPSPMGGKSRFCKVDVLTPDQLGISPIPASELYTDPSSTFLASVDSPDTLTLASIPIPYVPLSTMLMLKLQAWVDHSQPFAKENMHAKVPQDEDDIHEILRVGILKWNLSVVCHRGISDQGCWALGGFANWDEAAQSVRKFVRKWPRTAPSWHAVGFV